VKLTVNDREQAASRTEGEVSVRVHGDVGIGESEAAPGWASVVQAINGAE
jgi:hypothetical protein